MVPGPSNGLPEKTTNCLYQLTCLLNTHLNYYKLTLPMMLFFPYMHMERLATGFKKANGN